MAEAQDTGIASSRHGASCPLCGKGHSGEYAYMGDAHSRAQQAPPKAFLVCMSCASAVANIYWLKHAGEPLTWGEEVEWPTPYRKEKIPEILRWQVFARDDFTCVDCRSRELLTADHIIAESKGGPTTLENLTTRCRSCNSRKGAK